MLVQGTCRCWVRLHANVESGEMELHVGPRGTILLGLGRCLLMTCLVRVHSAVPGDKSLYVGSGDTHHSGQGKCKAWEVTGITGCTPVGSGEM